MAAGGWPDVNQRNELAAAFMVRSTDINLEHLATIMGNQ